MVKNLTIILGIVLCSCSSQWHLNRAIQKDPSILKVDTITVIDSVKVVTESIHTDSIFMVSKDTVTIIKDKLTIRHFIHNDSVWIYGECLGDTTYVPYEKKVLVDRWIYPEKSWYEHLPPVWVWLLGLILFIYLKYFKKTPTL